jgi:hypothetical protein
MTDRQAKQVMLTCADPYQVGTKWLIDFLGELKVAVIEERYILKGPKAGGRVMLHYSTVIGRNNDLTYSSSCLLRHAKGTFRSIA